jgi:hypothetical protein
MNFSVTFTFLMVVQARKCTKERHVVWKLSITLTESFDILIQLFL